jgi:hypothetical protein
VPGAACTLCTSGGEIGTSRPRPPRLLWPPFRPAARASSGVHSCAVPFSWAARPPLLAISRCFSRLIEANPRRSLRVPSTVPSWSINVFNREAPPLFGRPPHLEAGFQGMCQRSSGTRRAVEHGRNGVHHAPVGASGDAESDTAPDWPCNSCSHQENHSCIPLGRNRSEGR